ncbi:MAG: 3-phosphoshikimate 1-carboxyvinyltransferase [Acidimicrobiales bacterium]|nr:3-phosphoshikimate 1-carboxyvinyltransferase [Acidimicrobiales bacterium]
MSARRIEPVDHAVSGLVVVPGSKSITNRALLAAALADGTSRISGALVADDAVAMIDAVTQLGARVKVTDGGRTLVVTGTAGALPDNAIALYANQAATVGRFVAAVAAAGTAAVTIDADPQLRARPISPLFAALRELGAQVRDTDGYLPVTIVGPARGGSVTVPAGISSQFISALLLAGPLFGKGVQVQLEGTQVSTGYIALTASVMRRFGVSPALYPAACAVAPGAYVATDFAVEPDASAASYFFAAAAMTGGEVRVDGLGTASHQADLRLVRILELMGAEVEMTSDHTTVRGVGPLVGVDVDMSDCSDMVPTLAVAAASARTPTTIRGVAFIRKKETDRVSVSARELRRCGVQVEEFDDGLTIHPGPRKGAVIDPAGDHRMAMAFATLGLVTPGMAIEDPGCVAKTFPDFWDVLDRLLT